MYRLFAGASCLYSSQKLPPFYPTATPDAKDRRSRFARNAGVLSATLHGDGVKVFQPEDVFHGLIVCLCRIEG